MPFIYPHEVEEKHNLGDMLWRFNIAETSQSGYYPHVKPECGQLTSQKSAKACQNDTNPQIRYFVPFKNGKPVWNRAVKLESGYYALTENEANAYYYAMIQQRVDEHMKSINILNTLFADIPNEHHPERQALSLTFQDGNLKGQHLFSVMAPKDTTIKQVQQEVQDALKRMPDPQNGSVDTLCYWLQDLTRLKITHIWSARESSDEQS